MFVLYSTQHLLNFHLSIRPQRQDGYKRQPHLLGAHELHFRPPYLLGGHWQPELPTSALAHSIRGFAHYPLPITLSPIPTAPMSAGTGTRSRSSAHWSYADPGAHPTATDPSWPPPHRSAPSLAQRTANTQQHVDTWISRD